MSSRSVAPAVSAPGAAAARPAGPPPRRLLEQLRERIRYLHYSTRTEEAYVHWVRAFVRFHGLRQSTTMIYTHVLEVAGGAVRSPLDALLPA